MKHFNLEEFAGGKLSVQLNKALEKVTENIQDPNTDAQKAFDPDTGEIYEPSNKVIDLRKAKQA